MLDSLKPGGIVVEGTAGNTGIGLAHVCRAKGYKLVIFMPDSQVWVSWYSALHVDTHISLSQSKEKIDLLRLLGADVYPVPAVAYENPANYNHQARDYAASLAPHAFWTHQFDNTSNARIHYLTTGPEIWEQTEGTVDAFICSTGTGGTLAGVARYLREKSDGRVKNYLADPPGSVLYSYITSGGTLTERSGSSITEGECRVAMLCEADGLWVYRYWPGTYHGQLGYGDQAYRRRASYPGQQDDSDGVRLAG